MELPSAKDFADLPSPPPGMALSAFPPAREHWWDPFWWNQVGRDLISQRHIFDRYSGAEQKKMLAELLEEYPGKGGQIIDTAIDHGEAGVIESMLELGVEVERATGLIKGRSNVPSTKEDLKEIGLDENEDLGEDKEFYPLHAACFQKQFKCVKVLIEKGGIDVNAVDDIQSTPLLNAARGGDVESVKFLLDHGADPTFVREEGLGIFNCAATSGNVELLRCIADHPKSVEGGKKVDMELFACGTESGSVEMITFILDRAGLLVNENERREKLTAEHRRLFEENVYRVVMKESLESLDLLLSYLTPRNAEGDFEYYEISVYEDKVRVFNAVEDVIKNAAIFQRAWETLLAPPASILKSNEEAKALHHDWLHRRLHSAAGDGALETLKLIMDKYQPDVNHISHKYHMTSLFAAAAQGHVEIVRTLVEDYHADIHLGSGTYSNGPTALHNAIRNGKGEVSKLLLTYGGPVEALENLTGVVESIDENKKLVVAAFERYRAPVMVYSEEQFEGVKSDKDRYSTVIIELNGDDDASWIESLQLRKRDESLKEDGEGSRPLMTEHEDLGGENPNGDEHSSKKAKHMAWLERNGLAPK